MIKNGVTMTVDNLKRVAQGIDLLARRRVLVGVPQDETDRKDGEEVTNSLIGYVHEHGDPAHNIPARPHLIPGIRDARQGISDGMRKAGELALDGKPDAVERQLHRVGALARDSVKRKITTGPFAPLAPATIRARLNKHKGRKAKTAADVKPLIDTGQYRNSINYVIRERK